MNKIIFLFAAPIFASSNLKNVLKRYIVIQAFLLLEYLHGSVHTFLKNLGMVYFPTTRGGNFSLPSKIAIIRAVILSLLFFPPWHGLL
jgi:hypothetical protein